MATKVLIVDDSKTARKEVVRVVHNHGILTIEAQNGKEALAKLEEKEDIKLVFCDVNMPEMNGIEFLEAVKKQDKFQNLPVVMLTSEATQDVMKRAKELGVTGWIIKPADPKTVNTLLDTFCA
ncbi:response regulator [Pseudobacteriovorax antillogorgiicola]|uniref:Two-component system, chemotaxis family, response regulator CheY n=1 Tax=Pseudobacteriovorax antillogorgiicola TaxID=1513793 RepID=A0A1Y6CDB3_9BACT|nr:response regulator [Pseudobacteriovorax antillogorgiicola]TCS47916.1 two-component system chemotaxis response regulator CheY [Pseudobacteriovorax antillogorgiicola]SMF57882.1 two-component system, chemotaxis family, response regulator CheY [Pseudobacteriovorax antillogorgiicola]